MTIALIHGFKDFYRDLCQADMAQLDQFYAADLVFVDPVHQVRGLLAYQDYCASLAEGLKACRFDYLDELVGERSAYIKWNMHFRHPKLGGRLVTVRGVSHLQFDEQIYFHEDVYDLGAMLYEQLPLLGGATRWLKRRLSVS